MALWGQTGDRDLGDISPLSRLINCLTFHTVLGGAVECISVPLKENEKGGGGNDRRPFARWAFVSASHVNGAIMLRIAAGKGAPSNFPEIRHGRMIK